MTQTTQHTYTSHGDHVSDITGLCDSCGHGVVHFLVGYAGLSAGEAHAIPAEQLSTQLEQTRVTCERLHGRTDRHPAFA